MAEHEHNMGTTYTWMCTCPHVQCGIHTEAHIHICTHIDNVAYVYRHTQAHTQRVTSIQKCVHTHTHRGTQAHESTPIFLVVTSQFRVTPFIKFLESFEYLAS